MTRIRKHIRDRLSLWLWGLAKEQVSLKIINVREAGNFLNDEQKVPIKLVQHGFDNLSKCVEDFEIRFWEDERQRFEQLRKQRHLINRAAREVYDQEIEHKTVRDPRSRPVYVHCDTGSDRVGVAVGVYRIVECGWDAGRAIALYPGYALAYNLRCVVQIRQRRMEAALTASVARPAR